MEVVEQPEDPTPSSRIKRKARKLKNEPTNVTNDDGSIQVFDYVTARAKEFSSMLHAVKNKGGSKRTFQKLSRHLRRRAMSFDRRRLPWKLREAASLETESGNEVAQTKRSNRRKRRKPSNLCKEYSTRQSTKTWLETHIWHAKRMKMVDKWGYRLPQESYAKGIRVNYRYMRKGCLLSDISYYCCIEVNGNKAHIHDKLSCLFPPDSDFHSSEVVNGLKEGVAMAYYPLSYPYNCIGQVWLLWQPDTSLASKLWVWCHPSIHQAMLTVLSEVMNDSVNISMTITDLKDKLLRFRLIGPKSLSVLMSILHTTDPSKSDVEPEGLHHLHSSSKWKELYATSIQRCWWQKIPLDKHNYNVLHTSGGNVSNGIAVSLVTRDPRLLVPSKRQSCCSPKIKVENTVSNLLNLIDNALSVESTTEIEEVSTEYNSVECQTELDNAKDIQLHMSSFLFDESIRQAVSSSKIPDHVINDIRGKFFMKPEEVDLGCETNHIPVVLIKRSYLSKFHKLNVFGWDLLLPRNWGMAFWIALIYQGVRPCGMKELRLCCNLECLQPCFPFDYPDTSSGREEQKMTKLEKECKYGHFPPDKRPNFGKLRIMSPFDAQWMKLFTQENKRILSDAGIPSKIQKLENDVICAPHVLNFYVLRNTHVLNQLVSFEKDLAVKGLNASFETIYDDMVQSYGISSILHEHNRSLLTISMEIANHGIITAPTMISLPLMEDLIHFKLDTKYSGPVEPLAPRGVTFVEEGTVFCGEYLMTRKEMKVLKKQRKIAMSQKRRNKRTCDISAAEKLTSPPDQVFKLVSPPISRDTIGYINHTVGYRHTSSRFCAVGHCILTGWFELCQRSFAAQLNGVVCLIRGHSQQYRFAYVNIIEQP